MIASRTPLITGAACQTPIESEDGENGAGRIFASSAARLRWPACQFRSRLVPNVQMFNPAPIRISQPLKLLTRFRPQNLYSETGLTVPHYPDLR